MDYLQFLETKKKEYKASGFDVNESDLNDKLFPFQKFCVKRALKYGKFALFQDCGLGKTFQQLEWAYQVAKYTNNQVLILAPLAVVSQTIQEGTKFGINVIEYDGSQYPIQITNYEQLNNIDASIFSGVVLDESSILKNFEGAIKKQLIDLFANTPYKLACTATPSPNDPMELGNHSEFLNVMSRNEMLAMYFVHDGGQTSKWRIKGHATKRFYQFVGSWAIMLNKPDDIGYKMDGYNLPDLNLFDRQIITKQRDNGTLFNEAVISATNFNQELRLTKFERLAEVVDIVNSKKDEDIIIWIKHNDEGDELMKLLPQAKEVKGNDSNEYKVDISQWFTNNKCICKHEKKKSNTIENGIKKTKKGLNSTTKNTESEKDNGVEIDTRTIQNTETKSKHNQKEHLKDIQNYTLDQDLENTGSQLTNTMNCLDSKNISAQYAEANHHLSTQNKDCMSITATIQNKSEDCFVSTVIMQSENLKTISNISKEQLCTCGANKSGKVLISKIKIMGMGINMQNCNNQIYASLDFSFEGLYQGIRRSYRFGQEKEVNIYLITTDTMSNVIQSISKKQKQFEIMQDEMAKAINENLNNENKEVLVFNSEPEKNDNYQIAQGDCVQLIDGIEDESIGLSVFSPPFAELYVYSDSIEDMGNSKDYNEFLIQFGFLVQKLFKKMIPGRNVCVHCMDLPIQKGKEGFIGLRDFSGMILRAFQDAGFIYHSRVTIWKDPVVEMQRTKALGLLHKQIKKDSTMSRVGIPDYVLVFRKDGERIDPVRNTEMPVDIWQKIASPVWMDINYGNTLQGYRDGRDEQDEKHICPLQLETIERCIYLYSNPGDVVYSPFGGIGSEGFQAIKMDRKAILHELKESYYQVLKKNLRSAVEMKNQTTLF